MRPAASAVALIAMGTALGVAQPSESRTSSHFPPPPAIAPAFKVVDRDVQLAPRCDATSVTRLIEHALEAFNTGRSRAFANAFASRASFQPYSGAHHVGSYMVGGSGVQGRKAIERVVLALHRARHGWTAYELVPPVSSAGRSAIYGLFVRLSRGSRPWYEKGLKLVVACDSGLVTRWVGPAYEGSGRCSASATKSLAISLIEAANSGDTDAVDRLVAKGAAFKWYSVSGDAGQRVGDAARDRSTLESYIAARHEAGELLELIRFRFQGFSEGRRYAHFNMILVRSARDFPSRQIVGKGSLDCTLDPPQVAVWSI